MPFLPINESSLRRWRFFVTAAVLFFLSACSLGGMAEQERLSTLQLVASAGEAAWQAHDNAAALSAYTQAHRLAPNDGQFAFRLGYLHEKMGNYSDAAKAYREGLSGVGIPFELQHELTYRLALLEAFRLHAEAQVPMLLATLPPASVYAADLRAVLALLDGDGRKALLALNQARHLPLSQELSSTILYHAARAYQLTGQFDLSSQSLYDAINLAGNAPIAKDIAGYREFLLSHPRP